MYRTKVERLIALLPWLISNRATSLSEISQRFGIKPNEVIVDLTTLSMTGPGEYGGQLVDIQISDNGVVSVLDSQGLNQALKISDNEAKLISIVILDLMTKMPSEFHLDASSLLNKLTGGANYLELSPEVGHEGSTKIHQLMEVIENRQVVVFEYRNIGERTLQERIVSPFLIQAEPKRNLVTGFCHSSGAVRTFRIDRIERLSIDSKRKFVQAPTVLGNPSSLTVEAYVSAGQQVEFETYPRFEILEDLGDQKRIRFEVYNERHAVQLLLRNYEHMVIITPKSIEVEADQAISEFLARI